MKERLHAALDAVQLEDLSGNAAFLAFLEEVGTIIATYEPSHEELLATGLTIEINGESVL